MDETPQASAAASADPDKLAPLPLAAAGLTALDGLLTILCVAAFMWDSMAATPVIQRSTPMLALAGLAGVVVGGIVLVKEKRGGRPIAGSLWANSAVIVGLLLMTAAVFLPLLSALAMLVDESSRG